MIVKVATGVTSRIVEPSIFTEAEMDQIMSVPSYIYFEEHIFSSADIFDPSTIARKHLGIRPFNNRK